MNSNDVEYGTLLLCLLLGFLKLLMSFFFHTFDMSYLTTGSEIMSFSLLLLIFSFGFSFIMLFFSLSLISLAALL